MEVWLWRPFVQLHEAVNDYRKSSEDKASLAWTVNFSWNLPLEVFDCFKVVTLASVAGGLVVSYTHAVHEIHITDMGKMKSLFLSLANKYRKGTILKSDIFLKKKNGSFLAR